MSAMVWMVLPRPISSASIPFRLLLYRDTIHSSPWIYETQEKKQKTRKEMSALMLTGSGNQQLVFGQLVH